jgi:hypothetical protein
MNPNESSRAERDRQTLLQQLIAAKTALGAGLQINGFGSTAQAHIERAMAHIGEAYIAINETKSVRSVPQLVDDLNRVQQVIVDAQRRKSQRV